MHIVPAAGLPSQTPAQSPQPAWTWANAILTSSHVTTLMPAANLVVCQRREVRGTISVPPCLSLFVSKHNKHHHQERNSPESHTEKDSIHSSAPKFAQCPLGSPEGAVKSLQIITRVFGKLCRGWDFSNSGSVALLGLWWQGGLTLQIWQGECALHWDVHQYNACGW